METVARDSCPLGMEKYKRSIFCEKDVRKPETMCLNLNFLKPKGEAQKTRRNINFEIFFLVIALFAIDGYLRNFYGRSFFLPSSPTGVHIGNLSIALTAFFVIYKALQRNFGFLLLLIFSAMALNMIGNQLSKIDEKMAEDTILNLTKEVDLRDVKFSNEATKTEWMADKGKHIEKFMGCYRPQRRCIYLIKGSRSYSVSLFFGDGMEVEITQLHSNS